MKHTLTKKLNTLKIEEDIKETKECYIYGIYHSLHTDKDTLIKYDMETRKIYSVTIVPKSSEVIQIAGHIFICGGYADSYLNSLSEYIEASDMLNTVTYSKLFQIKSLLL